MLSRTEARDYAAHLIARMQFDWDTIAECHPSGEILEQEDCEAVKEALETAVVCIVWDEPDEHRTYEPEDR